MPLCNWPEDILSTLIIIYDNNFLNGTWKNSIYLYVDRREPRMIPGKFQSSVATWKVV